jgi:hypothetical protein
VPIATLARPTTIALRLYHILEALFDNVLEPHLRHGHVRLDVRTSQ